MIKGFDFIVSDDSFTINFPLEASAKKVLESVYLGENLKLEDNVNFTETILFILQVKEKDSENFININFGITEIDGGVVLDPSELEF